MLHKYLFTITTFSKLLAMILFIALPFLGFYLGMQYQQKVTITTPVVSEVQKTAIPTPTPIVLVSPLESSSWNTYTNNKIGFQIKYPLTFDRPTLPSGYPLAPTLYTDGSEGNGTIIFWETKDKWHSYFFTIEPYNYDLNQLIKDSCLNDNYWSYKTIDVLVSDIKGGECLGTNKTNPTENTDFLFFVGKGYKFSFDFQPHPGETPNENELEQIISTFKFTN
jgi:hypothetical protein